MEQAVAAGAHHPPLSRTKQKTIVYTDAESALSLVLMRFIEGRTFLDLNRAPNSDEQKAILQQAAIINRIEFKPTPLFDSWAIPNIREMYTRVRELVAPEDRILVEKAIAQYATIPVDKLPCCFVHGDLTKANVLKGDDQSIYLLDFSVANWYPRIQELAVIIANLLHDNGTQTLAEKCKRVAQEYSTLNPLTAIEKECLYPYTLAGVAMEFMGAHQEKFINGNDTEETDYWLNLGREGLHKELG